MPLTVSEIVLKALSAMPRTPKVAWPSKMLRQSVAAKIENTFAVKITFDVN